jgi:hypothetical protein
MLSAECIAGNYCTQQGACAPSGKGVAGAGCSSEGDCVSGLLCAQTGLTGVCQAAGRTDLGLVCIQTADCLAGLLCVSGTCTKTVLNPWAGVSCIDVEDITPKIYFHVPRATDPTTNTDFYRLPFPNDIRFQNGKVSLAGHPRPGPRILPFDLVDRYITAIEAESTGFSANPTILMRLSKQFNVNAFPGDCGVSLVDITPTSPNYTLSEGLACGATNASSRYVCGPYLWARTRLGSPLRPGTTYALLIRKTLTDLLGNPFGADDDFAAMLAATPPVDPALAAAYPAYLPLRNYIAAGQISAADLAAAVVFTVEKYEDPLAGIDATVAASPPPAIGGLVRCAPGVVSPCDDGKTGADHVRGCLAADSSSLNFDTYQGTIALPVFQQGTPPYLTPTDGGNIVYDGTTGAAAIQGTQKVCFALTVPKGVAPASGWPLVVYGHGTGGSYHSIIDLGLSDDYAIGAAPAGLGFGVDGGATAASAAPVLMAVLGYDGILHGTRNGGSTKAVGELVYNFLNPRAARDNALQAAADLLAIPHGLAGFAAQGIVLDGTKLALYGHSQGGNGASLVAARQSSYGTIVMSGTGGTLIYTLRGTAVPARRDRSIGGRCHPSRARPHADVLRALGLGEFRPPALSRTAAHHDRPPHPARVRYQGQLLGRANPAGLCLGGALQGCASARHRQFRTRSRGPATAGELQRVLRFLRQADRARDPVPARCNLRRIFRVYPECGRTRRDPRNAGDSGPRRDSDRVALAGTTAS